MAEIHVERKGRSPLPWILGLLLLAALAFMLLRGRGEDEVQETGTVVDTMTATTTTTP
jgi:hypothetical protein